MGQQKLWEHVSLTSTEEVAAREQHTRQIHELMHWLDAELATLRRDRDDDTPESDDAP